jgi:uncharacterized membrane protein
MAALYRPLFLAAAPPSWETPADAGAGKVAVSAYFTILVVLHIAGAIMGIGPSFALGVLGPAAGRAEETSAKLALTEAMVVLDSRIVTPVALVTQPLTGVLLIFERHFNESFFSGRHAWLIVAIVLYLIILYSSYIVSRPRVRRMIELLKAGQERGEEYARLQATSRALGPLFGVLTATIVILMIWKPGSGCGVQLC